MTAVKREVVLPKEAREEKVFPPSKRGWGVCGPQAAGTPPSLRSPALPAWPLPYSGHGRSRAVHGPRTGLWAFNTWMLPELLGPCCPARGEGKQGEENPPRQGLSSFLPGGMRVGKEIDSHAIFCMPEFGKKSRVVSTRGKKIQVC